MKPKKPVNRIVLYNTVELLPKYTQHGADRVKLTFKPIGIEIMAAIDGAGNTFVLSYKQLERYVQP